MQGKPIHRVNRWRRIFVLNRSTISAAQKTALARVLTSRYRRLCAGELYRIDGWPLPEPTEAVAIDTGLLLKQSTPTTNCPTLGSIICFYNSLQAIP